MTVNINETLVNELLRIAELADAAGDSLPADSSGLTQQEQTVDHEIESLSQRDRAMLIAVMMLGRGDAGSDFNALLHEALSSVEIPGGEDFARDPNLGQYLRSGISILQELGKAE